MAGKILKVVETVIEKFIIKKVDIDEVQFDFMPGCRTTNAILIYSCRRNIVEILLSAYECCMAGKVVG